MNLSRLAVVALLSGLANTAEGRIGDHVERQAHLAETTEFWDRIMQEDTSLTAPPVEPPPTPTEAPPTEPPPTPRPPTSGVTPTMSPPTPAPPTPSSPTPRPPTPPAPTPRPPTPAPPTPSSPTPRPPTPPAPTPRPPTPAPPSPSPVTPPTPPPTPEPSPAPQPPPTPFPGQPTPGQPTPGEPQPTPGQPTPGEPTLPPPTPSPVTQPTPGEAQPTIPPPTPGLPVPPPTPFVCCEPDEEPLCLVGDAGCCPSGTWVCSNDGIGEQYDCDGEITTDPDGEICDAAPTPSSIPPPPTPVALQPTAPAPTPGVPTPGPPTAGPPIAPSPRCSVFLSMECVGENGESCDAIEADRTICEGPPSELVMLYNGGDCSQSVTVQRPNIRFQCSDLPPPAGAGPPPLAGNAYIVAQARDGSAPYFEGLVDVGSTFTISANPGDTLPADTEILIRQDSAQGRAMQIVVFQTTCSSNLFLNDRYGASQVVGWTNSEQGSVDSRQEVTYNYIIENTGEDELSIISLTSTSVNPPGSTVDVDVPDGIIASGETITVSSNVEIDWAIPTQYRVEGEVVAETPSGEGCDDADVLEFTAGGDGGDAPAPTVSPAPTPDTAGQACTLEASVECAAANGAPCDQFTLLSPAEATCTLPEGPTQLGFIYRGGNCDESTASQDFACQDENGGPNEITFATIQIVNSDGVTLFFETVSIDFPWLIGNNELPIGEEISVTISNGNTVLQEMSGINVGCRPEDDFTLLTTFGGLQFVSYRNANTFVPGLRPVEWQYTVTNSGFVDATITELESITNGDSESQSVNIPLAVGESTSFVVASEIELVDSDTYTGEVIAEAITPGANNAICGATASASVTIGIES